jgi:hypothetical protein
MKCLLSSLVMILVVCVATADEKKPDTGKGPAKHRVGGVGLTDLPISKCATSPAL